MLLWFVSNNGTRFGVSMSTVRTPQSGLHMHGLTSVQFPGPVLPNGSPFLPSLFTEWTLFCGTRSRAPCKSRSWKRIPAYLGSIQSHKLTCRIVRTLHHWRVVLFKARFPSPNVANVTLSQLNRGKHSARLSRRVGSLHTFSMAITFVFVIILFSCTHGRMALFALLRKCHTTTLGICFTFRRSRDFVANRHYWNDSQ
jgi:hypothetical protein